MSNYLATRSFDHYQGQPSVEGVIEFKRTEKRRSGRGFDPLPGYGPKITSLFALFLAELGSLAMPDDSMPIDVHVQRIFIQSKAITCKADTFNEELEDILRAFVCRIAKKHNLCKIDLSHAFWQLGRTLCTGCYRVKRVDALCPVYSTCLGSIHTVTYFRRGVWPSLEDSVFSKKGKSVICIHDSPLFAQ